MIAGTWIKCGYIPFAGDQMCLPLGCAISQYTAKGDDEMTYCEMCALFLVFPFPLCEGDTKVRNGDTNRFIGRLQQLCGEDGHLHESKTCYRDSESDACDSELYMKLLPG